MASVLVEVVEEVHDEEKKQDSQGDIEDVKWMQQGRGRRALRLDVNHDQTLIGMVLTVTRATDVMVISKHCALVVHQFL